MHETSLMAELVDECERRAAGRPVKQIRIRHAASLDADGLRDIFRALTVDRPLAGAALDAEQVEVEIDCAECEYSGNVDADHMYGHVRVCPACGAVSDDAETAELELVDVVFASC